MKLQKKNSQLHFANRQPSEWDTSELNHRLHDSSHHLMESVINRPALDINFKQSFREWFH